MNLVDRLDSGRPSRRDLGRLLATGALGGAITACQPKKSESYPLEAEGQAIADKKLAGSNHPYLDAVRFSFNPARAGGSLVLEPTFKEDVEVKLISQETDTIDPKNPGF